MERSIITNVEELRKAIVNGIDAAFSMPILSRFISADTAKLMHAERDFWMNDDGVQLTKLLAILQKQP